MRTLIVLTGVVTLSACASYPYGMKPLTTEQSDRIETACGHRPVSMLRGARSPREVVYSACRNETLKTMRTTEDLTDAS